MTKTTWTAQTRSQLVAALARKGFERDEVRAAAQRAIEGGFSWAWGKNAGERNMALITFSDTEVDMFDASLHTNEEIRCDVCQTVAHAPATLTQVDGIGNACRYCMRNVKDLDATAARWNAMVEEGKLDAEHTAESLANLRNLAAHLAPVQTVPAGHYARNTTTGLVVFVLEYSDEHGTIHVRHANGTDGWGDPAAFEAITEDEELAAAVAWDLSTGRLVDAAEWMAKERAKDAEAKPLSGQHPHDVESAPLTGYQTVAVLADVFGVSTDIAMASLASTIIAPGQTVKVSTETGSDKVTPLVAVRRHEGDRFSVIFQPREHSRGAQKHFADLVIDFAAQNALPAQEAAQTPLRADLELDDPTRVVEIVSAEGITWAGTGSAGQVAVWLGNCSEVDRQAIRLAVRQVAAQGQALRISFPSVQTFTLGYSFTLHAYAIA
jgi:hypothetical protein